MRLMTLVGLLALSACNDGTGKDPEDTDTDGTDTDVVDTDVEAPGLSLDPGIYQFDAIQRWVIAEGDAETSNVMIVYMRIEVDDAGDFTGVMVNRWTVDEVIENADCTHVVSGSISPVASERRVTSQVNLDSIGEPSCDMEPDSPHQDAWTEALRNNFMWFGLVLQEDIGPNWEYFNEQNIEDQLIIQDGLGQEITHLALVEGTGDYYVPAPEVDPLAFYGAVERRRDLE